MNFPSLCVDNFYKNPDEVRNFALSLEYFKHPGNYPGVRTNYLHDIDNHFFTEFCNKLFSLYFNYDKENVCYNVRTCFQKIYAYSEDKNSPLNSGWYHEDSGGFVAAGVIYLNPYADMNAGTTIGCVKPNCTIDLDALEWRNKLYADELIDRKEYQHKIIDHNMKFDKTLEFKNLYNRLIMYDTQYWHKESNFFANETEPRLTQVFFVSQIDSEGGTPIQRMNKHLF